MNPNMMFNQLRTLDEYLHRGPYQDIDINKYLHLILARHAETVYKDNAKVLIYNHTFMK